MIGNLIGVVASRHRNIDLPLGGTITTTNTDPNRIGTVIRATSGEISLDGNFTESMELDDIFFFTVGKYIEFESSTSKVTGTGPRIVRGTTNGGEATVLFQSSQILVMGVGFSTSNSTNTFYKVRINHVSLGNFEVIKDGVSLGTQDLFSITGNSIFNITSLGRSGGTNNYISKHRYLDVDGKVFNFNEIGNNPTVTTG